MMTYYLFRTYRFFWGAKSGGGDTPVVGSSFLTVSNENGHDSPWETIIQDEKVIAFS
jgi:hypothetical protein